MSTSFKTLFKINQIASYISSSAIILFALILITFSGCNKKEEQCIDAPDVSSIEVTIQIDRLERKIRQANSPEEILNILNNNEDFAREFIGMNPWTDKVMLADHFFELLQNEGIDTLFLEVEQIFGDISTIEQQFEDAFRHILYFYPNFKIPAIQTTVTGFASDMFISDQQIIFGLDYYLGPNATFLPMDVPSYILKRYQKEYLVPQTLLLIADRFIKSDPSDQTALSEMIYYGKAYQFVKQMMPCVADSLITGYTIEESIDIKRFESVIWASMIENEFVYETNHTIKQKILGERPKTYEIGEKCPGRIGRWTGWQIVQQYLRNNPGVSLQELMVNTDAQQIFQDSKYKPGK
ncbi:MAG: gliding motility lipoprotein GldB [Cyclobacteriaceae bacterium]|nr:gliding motility lipoprotein GldB [Cyclobacteriaceae bacterium]